MELILAKATAIVIGLVLLWLVVNSLARSPRQSGYPGGYPGGNTTNYQPPAQQNPAYGAIQRTNQGAGCLSILALIGFLAVCAAGIMIGITLASRLPL